eukprot:scaffold35353_cov39-Cyclotella_meneghiniana.AAC.6
MTEIMMSVALLIDNVGGLSIGGVFETSSGLAGGRHIILLLDWLDSLDIGHWTTTTTTTMMTDDATIATATRRRVECEGGGLLPLLGVMSPPWGQTHKAKQHRGVRFTWD